MYKQSIISELSENQLDLMKTYVPNFSDENLERIKQLSLARINSKNKQSKKKHSFKRVLVIAAAVVLLLATATTVFAATGRLEQFLSRFNPNFGVLAIAPLYPAFAEDQGILIEAVGAQQIDHVVLVYVTMQDISGEKRLNRHMMPALMIRVDGQVMNGPSSGRWLKFDRSTNTQHYEMIIVGEVGMPNMTEIEVFTNRIEEFSRSGQVPVAFEGNWEILVNTSDLGIQPIKWLDVTVDNLLIEYISLSPFGVQIDGFDLCDQLIFPNFDVIIEFENQQSKQLSSWATGGGSSDNGFSIFAFSDAPISLDTVTAIIINGERLSVPGE
jgi:hypothetical protein